ncbi:MAG: S41 family peptidase [Prevotella pectinovora]|uniref:S41 family peptidase n=1 Tax=Prevotella pectinovora TaxID=1602169 RepID=UPI0026721D04|nr:S41 family peptidase [Prevotella pectinovora]MDY4779221.1 S41 family peptidase [Prevotella pectinovora]MEE1547826.1 S41 family peptidase [Prevotella pectinovora]
MNKLILATLLGAYGLAAQAQDNPLWMRHPAISPNGKTIAFSYQGDIFTVPSSGGTAKQITSNAAFDSYPVWSPDGNHIAFASNREGSIDVWVMDANGGIPKRVTTNSGSEYPLRWKDNSTIMFKASIMPTAKSIIFAGSYPQVYTVGMDGGRPKLFSDITMDALDINASGDVLYIDRKGYEDEWRKHHRSPITRDVWLKSGDSFRKLTTFDGEDRDPVWSADGKSFYYLSEQSGTLNVYHRTLDGKETQITNHEKNPVRFLSAATDGTLCYGYDGEIYTVRKGGQPQKTAIRIAADTEGKELIRQIRNSGAYNIKLSPNGKEIGFVMHGDVYVTSIEYRTTKQITNTPEQERYIDFSPDGRTIIYDSERNGVWQIYATTMKNKDEKQFAYATELVEERLTQSDQTSFQPKFSPDGKQIAFWENRGTLRVMDAKGKNVKTAMDGKFVYSYSDGDIDFTWSPDSKWLLSSYIGVGGWNNSDIALVNASGNGEIHNLTESGYNESNAKWVLDGKAMLFCSDRAGYRSHGSWGAEYDAYLMFFDLEAYERYRMNKEERALAKENMTEKEKKKEEKKEEKEKKEMEKPEAKEMEPLKFDLENCRDRIVRLTVTPSFLGDILLDKDGENIYYNVAFEKGMDLWHRDLMTGNTELLIKNVGNGEMMFDKSYKEIYLAADGGIKKVTPQSKAVKNIEFEAQFNYQPYKERAYMFDHVWRQVKDKFYDKNIHGVDWEGYRKTYERFLPYINNNHDFQEMLSEMLGELNASHTGARYSGSWASLQTASLGLFFDEDYTGDGLKIAEVIKGSEIACKQTDVKSGCIIEKIDGTEIKAGMDYFPLLDGKIGKPVRLTIRPKSGRSFDVTTKGMSMNAVDDLLYKRWVDRNRQLVDSLSGGRLAYVHVRAMNSESFRTVYRELLSDKNRNREAVIVDDRHNGGGWLHDDLCTLLNGKEYQNFMPRGNYIGRDPFNKWTKPSCVLICEDDYSNGHGFPMVYKTLGIGKLIGTPVAGTMTAVWWETMIDNTMVFGIPQVGCMTLDGKYAENTQLNPDITVYNTPEDFLNGNDRQLKAAIEEMMKQIGEKK